MPVVCIIALTQRLNFLNLRPFLGIPPKNKEATRLAPGGPFIRQVFNPPQD